VATPIDTVTPPQTSPCIRFAVSVRSRSAAPERARAVGVGERDAELFAAESHRHVVLAGELAQQLTEAHKHLIADDMSVDVVDALEVVQITDEERDFIVRL
jgi:hypothetical protein